MIVCDRVAIPKNAAIFAAQILALSDPRIRDILSGHKKILEQKVLRQGEQIPSEYRAKE